MKMKILVVGLSESGEEPERENPFLYSPFYFRSLTFQMKKYIQLIIAKHLRDELDVHVCYVDVLVKI